LRVHEVRGERGAARPQPPGCDLDGAVTVHALVCVRVPAAEGLAVDDAVLECQFPEVRHVLQLSWAGKPPVVADEGGPGSRPRADDLLGDAGGHVGDLDPGPVGAHLGGQVNYITGGERARREVLFGPVDDQPRIVDGAAVDAPGEYEGGRVALEVADRYVRAGRDGAVRGRAG